MAKEDRIDFILNNFNFDKCLSTMKAVGWTWYADRTPTIDELKQDARHKLEQIFADKSVKSVRSGGFKASREADEMNVEIIVLEFVLERSSDEMCL